MCFVFEHFICLIHWLLAAGATGLAQPDCVNVYNLCLQAEKAKRQRLEALLRDLMEIGKIQEAHDLLLQVMAWEVVGHTNPVHACCLC